MVTSPKKQIVVCIMLVAVLAIAFAADARELEVKYPDLPGVPPLTSHTTLPQLLNYFFRFFVAIGGLIAFGSIVAAGFLFMTSGANPGLRAKAMGRIRQAMLGLVLLLSTYIILNTINPELVFLREPGRDLKISNYTGLGDLPSIFDEIDYNSLRYGGVVVFDEPSLEGASRKSETIFHNVENFEESTFINHNDGPFAISAIKILGDCTVGLVPSRGSTGKPIPFKGPAILVGDLNNNVKELIFETKNCLGHSIKIFGEKNYNGQLKVGANGFAHSLLTNIPDLAKIFFASAGAAPPRSMDNNVRSLKFALDPGWKEGEKDFLAVQLCDEKGYRTCKPLSQSTPSLDVLDFDKKASSIQFDQSKRRQAGIVVYRDENFRNFHEIFIASDKNLSQSIAGDEEISSLQIIGRYRVTFYENPDFKGGWLEFDNTNLALPKARANSINVFTPEGSANLIFSVPDLNKYCLNQGTDQPCRPFNDKISSIKIEVPVELNNVQDLGGKCGNDNFCEL